MCQKCKLIHLHGCKGALKGIFVTFDSAVLLNAVSYGGQRYLCLLEMEKKNDNVFESNYLYGWGGGSLRVLTSEYLICF